MAMIGSIAIGMSVDTSRVRKGLASAGSQVTGFASSVASAGGLLKAALATAGAAAMGAAILKVAGEAAHLNEAIAKTEQIFGDSAAGVIAQADKMNAAYGTARKEYLDGTAALGGQLQGVGYAEKDAAALSVQFAALAADAAAFRDVGFDEALLKIRAGLSGESEPLKAWGVLIDEAAVKTEALRMGLIRQGQEMDNAAKVQARMSLITKGLAKDSGALSRESTSTANQMAEFWGRLSTLGETVGGSFVDGIGGGLAYVNQAIAFGVDNWGVFSEAVVGVVTGAGSLVVGWMSDVAEFFGLNAVSSEGWATALDVALGVVANGWQMVGLAFQAQRLAITSGVQVILGLLAKVGDAFDWVAKKTTGSQTGIGDYLRTLETKVKASTERQAAGLVEGWSKPWASETGGAQKIKDAFTGAAAAASNAWAATGAKIQEAREALAKPVAALVDGPQKTAAAAGLAKVAFAGAMTRNSADAVSTINRSRYGGSGDDATKKVAANTAKAAVSLDQLRQIGRDTLTALKGATLGPVPTISI